MKKLLLILLLVPLVSFGQRAIDNSKKNYDDALDLINEVRSRVLLNPLTLSSKLNKIASSRLDSKSINGEYVASSDDTGEIYYHTNRDSKNYFKDAVIGLIVPSKENFTYDQIICKECSEVGFAQSIIDDQTYTMFVFDQIYSSDASNLDLDEVVSLPSEENEYFNDDGLSFGQSDTEKYDSSLFFINMIREHQELKPLELDEKLNEIAQSRVVDLALKGFYFASALNITLF